MTNDLIFSQKGLAYTFFAGAQKLPPIVILHGLLGSHKNFSGFAKKFSHLGFPVLCIDLRNHGASFHDERFDYPAMAEDLEDLLCELEQQSAQLKEKLDSGPDWSRVLVLGHSLGGRIAMMFGLLFPRRAAALIIVDVVPSRENPDIGIERIVEAMLAAEPQFRGLSSRKQAEDILRAELRARASDSEAVLQFLLLCNLSHSERGFHWSSNVAAIAAGLPNVVVWPEAWLQDNYHKYVKNSQAVAKPSNAVARPSNPNVPLLLVVGGRSPYVDAEGWDMLLEYFPQTHPEAAPTLKHTIAEAYHWPHTETPEEFHRVVLEFLESLSV